jgi:predicted Zn-dependent protease
LLLWVALAVLLAALLPACCANRLRASEAPDVAALEALAGAHAAVALEKHFGGVAADAAAEARMARVLTRLHAGTPTLPDLAQCRLLAALAADAASLPGPRLYVTRGLYAELDEALLAAALAHELAHLEARDHFKPRCGSLAEALEREQAADARGVAYLAAAGYAPDAMQQVVRRVASGQPADWPAARCAALTALVPRAPDKTSVPRPPSGVLAAADVLR